LRVSRSNGLVLGALRSLKGENYYFIIILEVLRKVTEHFVVMTVSLYIGCSCSFVVVALQSVEAQIYYELKFDRGLEEETAACLNVGSVLRSCL